MRMRLAVVVAIPVVLLVAVLLLWLTRPSTDAQVGTFFEAVQAALDDTDAAELVGLLDAAYAIDQHWPIWHDALRAAAPAGSDDPARAGLQRLVAFELLTRRRDQRPSPQVSATVDSAAANADGSITAIVSIEVDDAGRIEGPDQPLTMTFTSNGWLRPTLRLLAHDQFQP